MPEAPFFSEETKVVVPADPEASPFKLVVDPVFRARLHNALFDLLENHHQELARHVADGFLDLGSCQEYVELFARYLRDTMGTPEGVAYLMDACGFSVGADEVNVNREARWRVQRG